MRLLSTYFKLVFIGFCICLTSVAQAQNTSESDVKKQAQKYFDAGDFTSALPLYSQLLSFYAKDPVYNYRYGVCALEAGNDREKPISYLEFASRNAETPNAVFYYLGKAYHLNYRFSSALNAYNTFKLKALKTDLDKFPVDRQLDMCRNGMELLKNISDLTVMEKKELKLTDYFRAYDLSSLGLKMLVKPDDFKTDLDKKKNEESVVVLNPTKNEIYFSSYGSNDKNGKDIYKVKRMDNGDWTNPIRLDATINSPYDEDYPFLSADGTTLYFCSKGHNSMGGYDVFKSMYNPASGTWGTPENMDFAINTPDDDILYVADEVNKIAYFSSRRASGQGNINVYKIKIGPQPPSIALISGVFSGNDENSHPEATITVRDSETKNIIGVYKSDPKTGNYSIPLPSSGKYIFNVESEVSPMKTETVIVPDKKDLGTLQQKISIKSDKLLVENIFDDAAINEANLQALLKAKANLEVNYVAEVKPAVEEPKVSNLSNQDLLNIAYQDAKDTQAEADKLKLKSDQAYALSKSKMDAAKSKLNSAETIEKNAQAIASTQEKASEIEKANQLKKEAKAATMQAYAIYTIAKNIEDDASSKQAEADQSMNYAKELDKAVQINSKESIAKLTAQKNNLPEEVPQKNIAESASTDLIEMAEAKQQQADAAESRSKLMRTEILDIELKAESLAKDKASASDASSIKEITKQIDELALEKADKQKKLQDNSALENQLRQEADDLKNQSQIVASVMNDLKEGANLPAPTVQEKIALGNELAIDLGRANALAKVEPVLQPNNSDINDAAADAFITTEIGKSPVTADNFSAKMSQANKISDPVKREEQKNKVRVQMNANWDKEIASIKTQQTNSKDKNERASLQSRVTELENLKAMNSPTPEIALTTASEVNQSNTQGSVVKTTETNNLATTAPTKSDSISGVNQVTQTSTTLAENNSSQTNSPTETTKLAENSKATEATSDKQNTTSIEEPAKTTEVSTSTSEKKAAKTDSTIAVNTSKETISEPSTEVAKEVAKTENVAVSAAAEPVDMEKLEEDYNQQLAMVNKIADVAERNKANQLLAESWTKIADTKLAQTQSQVGQGKTSEELTELNKTLVELTELKGKIAAAAAPIAVVENTTNSEPKAENPADSKSVTTPTVTQNTTTPPTLGNVETAANAVKLENVFTSESAKVQARKADKINLEVQNLKDEEDSLTKLLAQNTDVTQADKLGKLLEATQREMYVKKIESLKAHSVANGIEFTNYADELKKASSNSAKMESDNVSRAEMLVAEAAYYFNEASIKSETSQSITDATLKEAEMKKIVELEKTAIEKQVRALATYGVPVYTASADTVKASNTDASQNQLAQSTQPLTTSNNAANDEAAIEKTTTSTTNTQPIAEAKQAVNDASKNESTVSNETVSATDTKTPATGAETTTTSTVSTPTIENKSTASETNNQPATTNPVTNNQTATSSPAASTQQSTTNPESSKQASTTESVSSNPVATTNQEVAQSQVSDSLIQERAQAFVYPTDTMKSSVTVNKAISDSVVTSPYYKYYNGLLVAATENMQQSSFYAERGDELKKLSVVDSLRAEDFITQASQAKDTLQMQQLLSRAAEATYQANDKKDRADSSYSVARRLKAASVDNKNSAARYIDRLSESDRDVLVAVMNSSKQGTKPGRQLAAATTRKPDQKPLADNTTSTVVNNQASSTTNNETAQVAIEQPKKTEETTQQVVENVSSQNEGKTANTVKASDETAENSQSKEAANTTTTSPIESKETTNLTKVEEVKTQSTQNAQATANSDLKIVVNERNELAQEAVFSKVTNTVYSKNNPIPINTALPSGIVFKVQIGAFRNPIPQDLFKGFDPISGETTPTGITRYTAGYFKNMEAANSAKREINGLGYKDAFVVAFCNGKRVSIPDAIAMVRAGNTCVGDGVAENKLNIAAAKEPVKNEEKAKEVKVDTSGTFASNALKNKQISEEIKSTTDTVKSVIEPLAEATKTVQKQEELPVKTVEKQEEIPVKTVEKQAILESDAGPVAPSVSFEDVKGLVYTVQVGVYSKPILANQLFNIQPLYFERTPNGLYRYTSGVFDNLEMATTAKASIVDIGVKDAFVTTYFNGSRIPVEQAKQLEAEKGKAIFANSPNLNKQPEINSNAKITGLNQVVPTVRVEKETPTGEGANKIALPVEGLKNQASNAIVFKVQIGVFRSEIPLEIAAIFLKLSSRGIDHYQTSDSLNIYTIGNLRDIKSANNLKDEVIQEGLPDAFVVAFKGGNKMKLEDAIRESSKK
jgi:hypothetical protein